MTIAEWLALGKESTQRIPPEKRFAGAILAATALAFGVGVVASKDWDFPATEPAYAASSSVQEAPGAAASVPTKPASVPAATVPAGQTGQGSYVASKSGTKFYLPICAGAKRIKDENKVWFDTEAAAEAAGYEPAANCKGL